MNTEVVAKRAYEDAVPEDGFRVLVDRLWPRGLTKERLNLDLWDKDATPSQELRREWHADPNANTPERFAEFAEDYRQELLVSPKSEALAKLADLAREQSRLTLVYAARNTEMNHAIVLRDAIIDLLKDGAKEA